MKIRKQYIAEDGTAFSSRNECELYEKKIQGEIHGIGDRLRAAETGMKDRNVVCDKLLKTMFASAITHSRIFVKIMHG